VRQVEQGQDIDLEQVEFTPELVVRQSTVRGR
jgi:LacI family transcriptional regulator